jgi:hypothetical protein
VDANELSFFPVSPAMFFRLEISFCAWRRAKKKATQCHPKTRSKLWRFRDGKNAHIRMDSKKIKIFIYSTSHIYSTEWGCKNALPCPTCSTPCSFSLPRGGDGFHSPRRNVFLYLIYISIINI